MNKDKWNTEATLDHYKGRIWISKIFITESRGNICLKTEDGFQVIGYMAPDEVEGKGLDQAIYDRLKANGMLWMLEKEPTTTVEYMCTKCGRLHFEEVPDSEYSDDIDTDHEHDFDCLDPLNWPDENTEPRIDEQKLKEYLEAEEIISFENEEEYLSFINEERKLFYSKEFPKRFTTMAEAKNLGVYYQLEYKGKIYWISYEECLDVYLDRESLNLQD